MNNKFTDTKNREWEIKIDLPTIRRVRETTGVDLAKIFSQEEMNKLADIILLVDVVYCCIGTSTVSADDFDQAFDGDTVNDSCHALLDAAVEFQPKRKQEDLRRVIQKSREVVEQAHVEFARIIDEWNFDLG